MESTRERSPNYPTLSLEAAVALVARLYEVEKRAAVPLLVVARALSGNEDSKTLSGPARSKIAVLRSFGLVEDMAPGKVRVSDRALAILQKPTPATYANAIREAALLPPLFAELFEEHRDASDGALKYHLMTERRFTEDGATKAMKSYRETLVFANLDGSSYTETVNRNAPTTEYTEKPIEARLSATLGPVSAARPKDNLGDKVLQMAYTWPLPDGVDAQVALLGNKPTVRAIDRLITYLEFMRDDLEAVPVPDGLATEE